MSQVTLEGLHEISQAEVWLRSMELKGSASSGLLRSLGTELVAQTKERLRSEKTAPDGTPWAGWSDRYQVWRNKQGKNPGDGVGVRDGHLLSSVKYHLINQYALEWGSSMEYAGYINGNPAYPRKRNYPLRPFVGISEANQEDLEDVAEDVLARLAGRGA